MPPSERSADEVEAEAVAETVTAGADTIPVPGDLLAEGATIERQNPSLYNVIAGMTMAQKVKLALRGNRDARTLLARDGSKTIRRYVLLNPQITEDEIIAIARDKNSSEDVLRMITARGDWMKAYGVRRALVVNPKTPLPIAVKQLPTLLVKDLERIAKSKDVPQAVVIQARKIVLATRERQQ